MGAASTTPAVAWRRVHSAANLDRELAAHGAGSEPESIFLTPAWLGTWLDCLPNSVEIWLASVDSAGGCLANTLWGYRRQRRHGVFRSDGLFLNESGVPSLDALTMEYNGLMARFDDKPRAVAQLLDFLERDGPAWNELFLSGLGERESAIWREQARARGLRERLLAEKPSFLVDLQAIRRAGGDYLGQLSRNTRHQIRRSHRLYGGDGASAAHTACSRQEALAFFAELKELHQAHWTAKGVPGAFANPIFESFHKEFIKRRFDAGEIQLIKVAAGEATVGVLYNLAYRRRVYAYQSGFRYLDDPKAKPGLLAHACAIEAALNGPYDCYDFMAGDGQHKRSMSTSTTPLLWFVLAKDEWALRAEDWLRNVKGRIKGA